MWWIPRSNLLVEPNEVDLVQRCSNEGLDPIRATIMSKVEEFGLNLKSLSLAGGLNETYLQQFVRKKTPKILPMAFRTMLATQLQVPLDALGGSAPDAKPRRPRGIPYLQHRKKSDAPPARPKVKPVAAGGELRFMNRGKLIPVFGCPSLLAEASVTDWIERPAHYIGAGAAFAIYVPSSMGRLRAGDLAFVHPAQPPDQGDTVVVASADRIVDIGEVVRRSAIDTVVLTAMGETTFPLSRHRVMRVALLVLR